MLKNIREEFEGVWNPQTGTIYPALKSLENRGLVETENRNDTEFYLLTEKGNLMIYKISESFPNYIKFTFRYIAFLNKWIPDDLTEIVEDIIDMIAKEDPRNLTHFIRKLDLKARRRVYTSLKTISEKRIEALEKAMRE
jgi:DNA-binding PadR family transcriptional regulator